MEKKILIAVDKSRSARNAVIYTAKMSAKINNLHFVLLHVEPMISQFIADEAKKNLKARFELDRVREKNHQAALTLLEGYKKEMIALGIDGESIETKSIPRKTGVVKDIITLAQEKHYDAIVVARRGISQLEELVMGSVSTKLVEHSRVIPVWIVDGEVNVNKIMIAVDGSEHCLRALDHVSMITHDNPDTRLTIYHVRGRKRDYTGLDFEAEDSPELDALVAKSNQHFIDEFHQKGAQMLREAGISADRIELRIGKKRRDVAKAILERSESGGFGTIVLGRSGMSKSFFIGSVSNKVINKAANRAVWLVP